MMRVPSNSISQQLDDILFTLFDLHIINYEPPRRFVVPKFTMYDRTNDSFDHMIHFKQPINIGNDALMCKVFPASLHG